MYFSQASVAGEDYLGLLGLATDKYAVTSPNFPDAECLKVPQIKTRVYGTTLVGLFSAGNSKGLLVPYCVSDRELAGLEKKLKKFKVKVSRIEGVHNALGNLIAANDAAAIVSPLVADVEAVEEALGVTAHKMKVGGSSEVGSALVVTNKGFMAHPQAESQVKNIAKLLGVEGGVGSVNYGVGLVGAGVIANSSGYIAGSRTSGIEMGKIDEALGFI